MHIMYQCGPAWEHKLYRSVIETHVVDRISIRSGSVATAI